MGELKFDKEGKLILPESIKEEKKKFTKKLILKYLGSETEGFIRCEIEINLPNVEGIRKKFFEVRDNVNKKVELKGARIWFEKNGNDYRLIISGRGHDERCTWCRSFRTSLDTAMFDLKVAVYQDGFCKFDKNGGYQKLKGLGTT